MSQNNRIYPISGQSQTEAIRDDAIFHLQSLNTADCRLSVCGLYVTS